MKATGTETAASTCGAQKSKYSIFGSCFDWRVLGGLIAVGLGVYVARPNLLGAVAPLLLYALCPLSMLLMMKMMMGGNTAPGAQPANPIAAVNAARDGNQSTAQLRTQLQSLQDQQETLRRELERVELATTSIPRLVSRS